MLRHLLSRPQPPDRVVIVGAGGFVGRAIRRSLTDERVPLLALTRNEIDLLAPGAALALQRLLRPPDSVVFVSALAPMRAVAQLAPNIAMAEVVCDALTASPVAHVVYISSDAVYADGDGLITESSGCQPGTLHGVMHLARELMLRTVVKAPLAILRPSLLHGPDDPHNGYGPNRFRRQAARGESIVLFGDGEEMRDHVFIDDVGALGGLVLGHRSEGVLNVASGVSTSFRQVADLVCARAPRSVPITPTPRQAPIVHRHFDVTACLQAFPAFRYTPLAEGIRLASAAG